MKDRVAKKNEKDNKAKDAKAKEEAKKTGEKETKKKEEEKKKAAIPSETEFISTIDEEEDEDLKK